MTTLQEIVDDLRSFGARQAFGVRRDLGLQWWTYTDLHRQICAVAQSLDRRGLSAGSRLLLWAPASQHWVAWLFGALLRGVIVVPVDEDATAEFVARVTSDVSPDLVVHGPDQDCGFLGLPSGQLEDIFAPLPSGPPPIRAALLSDTAAVIMYTSGTTMKPRGVVLTHGNLAAQVGRFRAWRSLVRVVPFRMLVIAPVTHVQGLLLGVLVPLSIGLRVIHLREVDAAHILRTIRDNRVTLLATVPRLLHVMAEVLKAKPYRRTGVPLGERLRGDVPGYLRRHYLFTHLNGAVGCRFWVIFVGGAPLAPEDEQFWRDTGRFVVQGYGLTETASIVSVNSPFARRVGSLGRPLQYQTIRIADDGELLVRGPNISPGFYRSPSSELFEDGFLRTGDLVRRDRHNRLFFVGRKKEVIVTGEGFNVFPTDVEAVLNRTAGVIDSVVAGVPAEGGEEVHAVLLLRPGIDGRDVLARANSVLESHQRIRTYSIWPEDDFPRSSLLKVQRDRMRQWLAGRRLAAVEGPSTIDGARHYRSVSVSAVAAIESRCERLELLARCILSMEQVEPRFAEARLREDLGLSSLDVVELITRVERLGNISLDTLSVPLQTTITDLAEVASSRRSVEGRLRCPTRQPRWSETAIARWWRPLTQHAIVGSWGTLCHRVRAVWHTDPAALTPPLVFAATPHRHYLDAFAVCASLPIRLRRRLAVVTNRDFREFFDPRDDDMLLTRLKVGIAYYFSVPLLFEFAIVPPTGATREGLLETARLIDRGSCPITFPKGIHWGEVDLSRHDPGVALLALECGVPIVPVLLEGNERLGRRPRISPNEVRVHLGEPVSPQPRDTVSDIIARLETAWSSLHT